jgi:glycosyltransferase involved in cell wall biosynthesis
MGNILQSLQLKSTSSTKLSLIPAIAIISTHPIQYNAPLFKFLAESGKFTVKVFYTWGENSLNVYDPGFGKQRSWDIDLLSGYDYTFVRNTSTNPGSHHHKGIINPDIIEGINEFKPDAIIIYGWNFNSHLKIMRHFKGKIPILFRGDSTLLDEKKGFSVRGFLRQQYLKWVYSHVDFALSPGTASDAYFKFVVLKQNQIVRAAHAVENSRFSLSFRAKRGTSITFLFAGKFEAKKNPLLLIRAFKKLYETNKNIHLTLVGDGVLKDEIINELKELSIQNEQPFTLLPFQNQSQMPSIYNKGDIFVLPSQGPGETWGLAINEAMASGCAVIASDKCGGAEDLIEDEKNGYIFKSGDEDDLVDKMQNILKQDRYIAMGGNSTEKIQYFSYRHFLDALTIILKF